MSEGGMLVNGTPEYYIEDVEISLSPEIGQTIPGNVSVTMEMTNPDFDSERLWLTCEGRVKIDLIVTEVDEDSEEKREFGDIKTDFIVLHKPEQFGDDEERERWVNFIEEQLDNWGKEGYKAVNQQLKFHLESELLSDVLMPINQLVKNQFRGLAPRVLFQSTSSEEDEEDEKTSSTSEKK